MATLSPDQREILEALMDHWELLRWSSPRRWHMGDAPVDGRAVRGLVARGLVEPGGDYAGGQLVLTDLGREVLSPRPPRLAAARGEGEA